MKAAVQRACRHCGTPVPPGRSDEFCCAGCAYVFTLLHDQGLDHFYDLRGGQNLPPVPSQALRERDYQWLNHAAGQDGAAGEASLAAEITLAIQGLTCIGCVWLVEKVFFRQPGALAVQVDVVRGELRCSWQPGRFDIVAFARELQAFGYLIGPRRAGEENEQQTSGLERRMGVCGAFAMNAMAFSLPAYFGMPRDFVFAKWFDLIAAGSATLAVFVGGSYFGGRAWRSLRMGSMHIDVPIALGIAAAYLGSIGGWMAGVDALKYFDFVAIFIFLMLAGRWAQQAAVERNRRKLMRDTSIPESVRVQCADGGSEVKAMGALAKGDRYWIKGGQAVPVASALLSRGAAISLEWINGESEAQHRVAGQMMPSGALNIGTGEIEAEALEPWAQSTLRRLLEARKSGGNRDLALEKLLRGYLFTVIAVGIGGAIWWWLREGRIATALQVMISVFVVSCPCALGVAAPLADDLAASWAGKMGVFVRTLGLWKKLVRVRKAVFDKTGTLTLENPVLKNPGLLASLNDVQRGALRTLVSGNLHPVSRSLFDALGVGGATAGQAAQVQEVAGEGLSCEDAGGNHWTLGKPARPQTDADPGQADAEFRCNGELLAAFSFTDQLRPESVAEMQRLAARGLDVFILSGDRPGKVETIARQLALPAEQCHASLTPDQKAQWVRANNKDDLLYIGDGANDSLAFDAALCAGSPVTGRSFLEHKADFYFLGHSMGFASDLIDVAKLHRAAIRRVFAFAVTYNAVTAAMGLAGHLNPLAAAILMPLSSVATLGIVAITFAASRRPGVRGGRNLSQEPLSGSQALSGQAMVQGV